MAHFAPMEALACAFYLEVTKDGGDVGALLTGQPSAGMPGHTIIVRGYDGLLDCVVGFLRPLMPPKEDGERKQLRRVEVGTETVETYEDIANQPGYVRRPERLAEDGYTPGWSDAETTIAVKRAREIVDAAGGPAAALKLYSADRAVRLARAKESAAKSKTTEPAEAGEEAPAAVEEAPAPEPTTKRRK